MIPPPLPLSSPIPFSPDIFSFICATFCSHAPFCTHVPPPPPFFCCTSTPFMVCHVLRCTPSLAPCVHARAFAPHVRCCLPQGAHVLLPPFAVACAASFATPLPELYICMHINMYIHLLAMSFPAPAVSFPPLSPLSAPMLGCLPGLRNSWPRPL